MLRFANYDIVFQEIPGEVTLAINITACPNRCKGCHSPHLWDDTGDRLDRQAVAKLLTTYGKAITCVCFMGGDAHPQQVLELAIFVKTSADGHIKTAWYSGRDALPSGNFAEYFNYIKLGAYIQHLGGLDASTTNQRFYRIENGTLIDETQRFHKTGLF
jgi:anaerobic ribonucleoside-triphosphate reductase activating protein